MLLRYLSDFTAYQQMADILGIPIGTVRSRLSEGRKQLTQQWNRQHYADEAEYRNACYWTAYYTETLPGMYDDTAYLSDLLDPINPALELIFSSGNLSFMHILFANSPEFPDHCPPSGYFLFYRKNGQLMRMPMHHPSLPSKLSSLPYLCRLHRCLPAY